MTPAAWALTVFLTMPNGTDVTLMGGFAKTFEDCRAYGAAQVEIQKLTPLFGAVPQFKCKPVYEVK